MEEQTYKTETFIGKDRTTALHTNDSGFYQAIRELVVAVVTYRGSEFSSWAAYSAFVPADMNYKLAIQIISESGDKLDSDQARETFSLFGFVTALYRT